MPKRILQIIAVFGFISAIMASLCMAAGPKVEVDTEACYKWCGNETNDCRHKCEKTSCRECKKYCEKMKRASHQCTQCKKRCAECEECEKHCEMSTSAQCIQCKKRCAKCNKGCKKHCEKFKQLSQQCAECNSNCSNCKDLCNDLAGACIGLCSLPLGAIGKVICAPGFDKGKCLTWCSQAEHNCLVECCDGEQYVPSCIADNYLDCPSQCSQRACKEFCVLPHLDKILNTICGH